MRPGVYPADIRACIVTDKRTDQRETLTGHKGDASGLASSPRSLPGSHPRDMDGSFRIRNCSVVHCQPRRGPVRPSVTHIALLLEKTRPAVGPVHVE